MMHYPMDDTIAAIATAPGSGAIGIVRISGPSAEAVLDQLFVPSGSRRPPYPARQVMHGWLMDPARETADKRMDEIMAVLMRAPASATGEDVVEFHCHGGTAIVRLVLETVLAAGSRSAMPGEFTYRAFMNGRIDLTQAEAVAELIAAPGREGARLALAKLDGVMGTRIRQLREGIDRLRATLCLAVDFPDEDVESLDRQEMIRVLTETRQDVARMAAGYSRARLWREGALVVLLGKVNMGKSSLLNALLGRERAIVSDIPGTTRDFIEESLNLDGLLVRITDTAGLRESGDTVEKRGIRVSLDLSEQADALVLVTDARKPLDEEEQRLVAEHGERVILARNKSDLLGGPAGSEDGLFVSARTGEGLEELAAAIRQRLLEQGGQQSGDYAPNLRQSRLLEESLVQIDELMADAELMPADILGVGLDRLASLLGEVTGESTPDAILGQIFSEFCIGK